MVDARNRELDRAFSDLAPEEEANLLRTSMRIGAFHVTRVKLLACLGYEPARHILPPKAAQKFPKESSRQAFNKWIDALKKCKDNRLFFLLAYSAGLMAFRRFGEGDLQEQDFQRRLPLFKRTLDFAKENCLAGQPSHDTDQIQRELSMISSVANSRELGGDQRSRRIFFTIADVHYRVISAFSRIYYVRPDALANGQRSETIHQPKSHSVAVKDAFKSLEKILKPLLDQDEPSILAVREYRDFTIDTLLKWTD